jgi:hypothetical protein
VQLLIAINNTLLALDLSLSFFLSLLDNDEVAWLWTRGLYKGFSLFKVCNQGNSWGQYIFLWGAKVDKMPSAIESQPSDIISDI